MSNGLQALSVHDELIYTICLSSVMSVGLLGNVLFAITIFIQGLESKFTTYMVRSQAIIDSIVCFIALMMVLFPKPLKCGNVIIDGIICRIWTSQAMFWGLVLSSVYNLVFTAIDRYWAVMTPQKYKHNLKRRIFVAYFIIFGMCAIITVPSFLQSKFNGNCTSELQFNSDVVKNFFKGYSVLWFLAVYGVPAPIMIFIYCKIFWHLHESVKGHKELNMKTAMKSFTKGTSVATGVFLVTISYDAIYYMLGYYGTVEYVFNNPIQVVGMFLTAVNSVKNPIVFFVMVKKFRQTFLKIWCKCLIKALSKRVSDNGTNSFTTNN